MASRCLAIRLCLSSCAAILTAGCAGNVSFTAASKTSSTSQPSPAVSLAISGATSLTAVGQTLQLHASETTGSTAPVDVTASAVWAIAPAGFLTVNSTGLVTCLTAGSAQISVAKDGASASVSVSCTVPAASPAPTPLLLISGATSLTAVGQTLQLHASETTGSAAPVDVTASAVWAIAPAGFLTVNSTGLVTCLADGAATVSIAKDGASAAVPLACNIAQTPAMVITGTSTIAGIGSTTKLSVTLQDSSSSSKDVTASVTWKELPSGIVSIDAAGLMTCQNIGSSLLTATKDVNSASLAVTCNIGETSLSLSRPSLSFRVGAPEPVLAFGASPGSKQIDVTQSAAWTTGSNIATVSSQGIVSCLQDGLTTVTASLASLAQTAALTCSPSSWNTPGYFTEEDDEFAGPFASWVNVMTTFGAAGDGVTDDTAAIQAALDTIDNAYKTVVLWFPPGQYMVNSLQVKNGQSFSLIGADPTSTKLKYTGPAGGTMLEILDSLYFRVSRLSFDGSGNAGTAEVITASPNGAYSTFNEISDQHISGTQNGIALLSDAETTIERIYFDSLPGFGVQTGNANVLNIFVSDCLFVKNGLGVTNIPYSGNFIVSNSFFSHSTQSDMAIGNTGYYTSRHNTSVGSAAVFQAGMIGANPAQITIQNNTVIDPTGIPFVLGDQGPLMLIDNVIRTQTVDQPVIWAYDDNTVSRSIFTIGNTYTTSVTPFSGRNLPFQGVVTSYDDSVTDPSRIPDVTVPANVYVPRNLGRTIFDVAPSSSGTDIQAQINLAVSSGGVFPVVHMPAGTYDIQQTIVVPFGSKLHLVGDDAYATALRWNGTGKGPVIEVGGSTVTMEGFRVVQGSGSVVDGFHVPITDQPNTQVIVDDVKMQAGSVTGINFDGLEHSNVELSSTYVTGSNTGVSVTGGPFRAANVGAVGSTNYYSGSAQSDPTSTSFNIALGGRLLVQDNWHDQHSSGARNFILSGSGVLTEQVGAVFTTSDTPFEIDNFNGKVSLIGLLFQGNLLTKPGSSKTNLLTLGLDGSTPDYQPKSGGNLVAANILNEYYDRLGGHQIPSGPAPDAKWLRSMLAQTRSEYPVHRLPMSSGGSRARFRRIQVDGLGSAFHFLPTTKPSKLTYSLAIGSNLLSTGIKGTGACAVAPQTGSSTSWTLIEAGDGDYIVADSTGTYALGVDSASSAISLSGLDNQYDQRWMIQDVGDGRKLLKSRGATGFLAWTFGACPNLVTDPSLEIAKWLFTAN